jgi:pimeloyl-ACP methyl ester carboxylesterase
MPLMPDGTPKKPSLERRARRALSYGIGIGAAVPRTIAFAGSAWMRSRREDAPSTPHLSPAFIAQVALDEIILAAMKTPGRFPHREDYTRARDEMLAAYELFRENGWDGDPSTYHVAPLPPEYTEIGPGFWMGEEWKHLRFPSGFDPFVKDTARKRWLDYEPNQTMHAWYRRKSASKPWIVCVHPYGTGRSLVSGFMFKANQLADELDANVAMVVLPLHGARGPGVWSTTAFMTYNPVDFLLGLTQSVWDVRRFLAWLRQTDDGPIALYGVSLGAHVSATVAGLDHNLAGVVAGVPTCDLLEVFLRHVPARLKPRAIEHQLISDQTKALLKVTSPLSYPSLVTRDRLFIFAGTGDRMSPPSQALALWRHWNEPKIRWFDVNHMAFIWNPSIAAFVRDALARSLELPRAA